MATNYKKAFDKLYADMEAVRTAPGLRALRNKVGEAWVQEIRRLAPRKTGALALSVRWEDRGSYGAAVMLIYGLYQDLGTRPRIMTIKESRFAGTRRFDPALFKVRTNRGITARQFTRAAWESNKVQDIIKEYPDLLFRRMKRP